MQKNLSLIIKANQNFIRHTPEEIQKNYLELNRLFETMSNVYIPLLNMMENFEKEEFFCKIAIVLPPVLCTLLADNIIQDLFIEWLDKRNELGNKELSRNSKDSTVVSLVQTQIDKNNKVKNDFVEKFQRNLISSFNLWKKKGYLEILGTCGTDIYFPHYADMKEIISAQIETGLHAYKETFGEIPDGFWLPELGYTPGVEKLIRAYGYTYIVLDARSLLLAETIPSKGLFYPTRTENSLILFGCDPECTEELIGEDGYANTSVYRNKNRDIGFELPESQLAPVVNEGEVRFSTGFAYWNNDFAKNDGELYDFEEAKKSIESQAEKFLIKRADKLNKAQELLPDNDFVSIVCTFDEDEIFMPWDESLLWFETVIRKASSFGLSVVSCDEMLENQYQLEKCMPYYSSSSGSGYGENLLSSKNCWMMRYIRKACERMVDLADRFPGDTGLKTRLLNLGAKELMIAQSLELARTIDSDESPEYAQRRFSESIKAFTDVFDSLGSNTVSTEWLTTLEEKDCLFPWMNYRIFSKKH